MADRNDRDELSLPKCWPRGAKAAVVHAISLASAAFTLYLGRWLNSLAPKAKDRAERERLEAEVAVLREELRIKDARMGRLPARNRPHYDPPDRLAILELRAMRGWPKAETARRFFVEPATIASWMKRLDEEGEHALVRIPQPVNRFPDFVRHLVRRLKALCPAMGKVKIAETLARVGLHLAATTVGRMLKQADPSLPAREAQAIEADAEPVPERTVTAKRPNHVWHVDLAVVPTVLGGFWSMLLPGTLPQVWPFAWWVALAQDHFSRRVMGFAVFLKQPTSLQVRSFLGRAFGLAGEAPKYVVCDKGPQFWCGAFKKWCGRRGTKPRYGAVGKCGSIAVIERLIRTVKDECTRRITVPLRIVKMRAEIHCYVRWSNEHRPHAYLGGRTPNEAYFGRAPANEAPRLEPRLKYPRDAWCASPQTDVRGRRGVRLTLEVSHFGGKRHLPVVEVRPAA
jgi:transposase InsO family protein